MPPLQGSKTEAHLKAAFASESMANRRYLYFAQHADVEGRPEVSQLFRSTADSETSHALGHLEFLAEVGDPMTDEPIGHTRQNLAAAIAGELREANEIYPAMARIAREEGLEEIAAWFEATAKRAKIHAARLSAAFAAVVQAEHGD